MVTIVFIIGAVNLGLGFGLAVLLERALELSLPRWPQLRLPRWRFRSSEEAGTIPPTVEAVLDQPPPSEPTESELTPALPNDFPWLPQEWAEVLTQHEWSVQSFLEAELWIVRLATVEFLKRLRQLDSQIEPHPPGVIVTQCRSIGEALKVRTDGWLTATCGCAEPGHYAEPLDQFRQRLQLLSVALSHYTEAGIHAQSASDPTANPSAERTRLHQLFSQLTSLLEWCDGSLARLLRMENRLASLSSSVPIAAGSAELYRLEVELRTQEWLARDPERIRMVSAALVDVDQCGQLNDRYGLATTDAMLRSLQPFFRNVVRKDRGFDRVGALGGQTFLILLGDTGLRNATTGAERIRQNLAATQFKFGEVTIPLTGRLAVTEWLATESLDDLLARLRAGLPLAKQAGGNCTAVCAPDETRIATPSPMQVPAREIKVT